MQQIVSTPLGDFRIPAGVRVAVIVMDPSLPSVVAPGADAQQQRLLRVLDGASAGAPQADMSSGDPKHCFATPLARAQHIHRTRGNITLKVTDWADEAGVGVRELRRAIKANAVEHGNKPDGRDNGAKTICADALVGYLAEVDAVRRGDKVPPAWWPLVHQSKQQAAPAQAAIPSDDDQHGRIAVRQAA